MFNYYKNIDVGDVTILLSAWYSIFFYFQCNPTRNIYKKGNRFYYKSWCTHTIEVRVQSFCWMDVRCVSQTFSGLLGNHGQLLKQPGTRTRQIRWQYRVGLTVSQINHPAPAPAPTGVTCIYKSSGKGETRTYWPASLIEIISSILYNTTPYAFLSSQKQSHF